MNKLKKELNKLYKKQTQISIKIAELKASCNHEETFNQDYFVDGSYYNVSEYRRKTKCCICGETFNDRLISTGSYG